MKSKPENLDPIPTKPGRIAKINEAKKRNQEILHQQWKATAEAEATKKEAARKEAALDRHSRAALRLFEKYSA